MNKLMGRAVVGSAVTLLVGLAPLSAKADNCFWVQHSCGKMIAQDAETRQYLPETLGRNEDQRSDWKWSNVPKVAIGVAPAIARRTGTAVTGLAVTVAAPAWAPTVAIALAGTGIAFLIYDGWDYYLAE